MPRAKPIPEVDPAAPVSTGDAPRDAAFAAVHAQVTSFPEFALDALNSGAGLQPVNPRSLPERDAALAHAIYDATLARWLTLRAVTRALLTRPDQELLPHATAALLAASAQLLFLDRLPAYAVINHAVSWVKAGPAKNASGMVNAVLRRVAELAAAAKVSPEWTGADNELPLADGGALVFTQSLLPGKPADRVAAATSHPAWAIGAWTSQYGLPEATRIAHHNLARPPIVLNVSAATASLDIPGLAPHSSPSHRVWLAGRAGLIEFLAARRDIWVQDSASSRAVDQLKRAGHAPKLLVDLCAGQGTKTRQLAAAFPAAEVIACDADARRVEALKRIAASIPNVRVVGLDEIAARVGAKADLVLADVPCGNSGTLARRIEARYRLADRQQARLVDIQRGILKAAAALLAPKGVLLYSTCSIERAENQRQAAWAVSELGLLMLGEELTLPAGLPGEGADMYHDGSYWAMLGKP